MHAPNNPLARDNIVAAGDWFDDRGHTPQAISWTLRYGPSLAAPPQCCLKDMFLRTGRDSLAALRVRQLDAMGWAR